MRKAITCLCGYVAVLIVAVSAGSSCNFGPGCSFPCRCAWSSECDTLTGQCPQGCDVSRPRIDELKGWDGPGCQTGNVAQGQLAWQYGQFKDWSAERSVNGLIDRSGLSDYSHPAGDEQAWWTVDLGKLHRIYDIIYANTAEVESYNYSTSMRFYVGNTSIPKENIAIESLLSSFQLCGSRDRIVRSENAVISCQSPLYGRYVVVYKASRYIPGSFVMAEVMVKGHIYVPCSGCSSTCNEIYGCISDCPPGKIQSTFCASDCPRGKYGSNCSNDCSGHCAGDRLKCNPTNGKCDNGCETWWGGQKCDSEIGPLTQSSFQGSISAESTSSTIKVTWDHLTGIPSTLAEHYGYKVMYIDTRQDMVAFSTSEYQAKFVVEHLEFHKWYTVKVLPCRKDGNHQQFYEELAKSVTIKTKCKPPESPKLLTLHLVNVSTTDDYVIEAVRATWKVGEESNCDEIDALYVEYNTSSTSWHSTGAAPDQTSAVVEPYYPGWYKIRVKVRNNELLTSVSKTRLIYVSDYGERPISGAMISGIVIGLLCFVLIIIMCIYCRRKKKMSKKMSFRKRRPKRMVDSENNYKGSKTEIILLNEATMAEKSDDEPDGQDIPTDDEELALEHYDVKPEEQEYENTTSLLNPIALSQLADELKQRECQDDGLTAEMKMLPGPEYAVADTGKLIENKEKNRFRNIIPFDHSRVLSHRDDHVDSDYYINANYITGYSDKKKKFVATQGPRHNTVSDFWRMVWDLQVETIVMLTPLIENKKKQCEQYWPKRTGESMMYGPFQVTLDAEKVYSDYTARHMQIHSRGKHLRINQFHYRAWPDKGVPKHAYALLAFMCRIKNHSLNKESPTVVHCSAGVGRTGTFIALDILMNQALAEDAVSIYSTVHGLRTERPRMVQTLGQYTLLYKAMVDFAKTGKTSIVTSEFPARYTAMMTPLQGDQTPLSEQYSILRSLLKETEHRCMVGLLDENKTKNRHHNIVPPDACLPNLRTPYKHGNEYINACFVDSPDNTRGFITTQTPLPTTMVDFWRLVYDQKCTTIIMLNVLDQKDCPQYWPGPSDPDMYGGPFSIRLDLEERVNSKIMKRELSLTRIRQGDSVQVTQLQLVSDSDDHADLPDTGDLLDLMDKMDLTQAQHKKTIVMCKDGVTRCGVLCSACHIINRVKAEQDVDVFLAARTVASHNQHFVSKFKHYKYLHELVLSFISRFDIYANFKEDV